MLYRHALKLDAAHAPSWNQLGRGLVRLGFHDLAVPCFRQALTLDPQMERVRVDLRRALERRTPDD